MHLLIQLTVVIFYTENSISDLSSFPWRRSPGPTQIRWFSSDIARSINSVTYLLTYVDEDYPAGPGITEPLPERSN